ncbi:MAG: hypothetical protein D6768_09175 [Chloroflexi bacterium]|nr:MAG: hypothetical protein D6768_09175 [Chloroflexota bacterium]
MPADFIHAAPNPGALTLPPPPPADVPLAANLPDGMHAFWGHLHAHTTYSDGSGPPRYALAVARAAGLHFYALTDHGWRLDDVQWADVLSRTAEATIPGQFVAFGGTEWSHPTAGHLTILNSTVRVNKEHPLLADLPALYTWLATNPAVVAQFNHPDPARGGNFNDFAPNSGAANNVALQEIGNNAQQYTTYETAFLQSNFRGWRVAPTINGDTHTPNWGSDLPARTGIVAPQLSRNALLDAIRARRVFATEDSNFALALRANGRWMGSVLTGTGAVSISVTAVDPDAEPATLALYDRNLQLAETTIHGPAAEWQFTIEARPGHFYWVKAVQADGDRAYSAPVWVEGQAEPERVIFSEILPAPIDVDWDGDGVADYHDEWIELRNSSAQTVGLGGWQVRDSSGAAYVLPLNTTLPPGGFITLYYTQTGISLNNSGDSLALIDPAGAVADTLTFDHTPGYDESWCLLESWSDNCAPSPGDANREIPPAEPLQVNIFEAKRLSYNAWVQVKGTVTAPPGIFGARQMYIQDDSSGILVYLPKDFWRTLNLGDRVRVTGNLRSYHQEFEIVVDEPADVKVRGAGVAPPPLPLATTSLLEPYEGLLVQLQGQAVQFRRNTFWVDDGTDPAKVTIRRSTGIRKPYIPAGAAVTVVGIVSQYSDKNPTRTDYRLLPRYPTDLVVPQPAPPPVPENWPSLLPDTGYR